MTETENNVIQNDSTTKLVVYNCAYRISNMFAIAKMEHGCLLHWVWRVVSRGT